jgi:rhamnose transport system ATP-binding protein
MGAPLLACRHLSKSFGGGTQALRNVSLDFQAGMIHGLVGENGAGKSTLGGVVTGLIRPDQGSLKTDGAAIAFTSAGDARRAGFALVSQELSLAPAMTVLDNVFLGSRKGLIVRRSAVRRKFDELCDRYGISLPATAKVRSLSLAQRQHVEVLRALAASPRLIVFDEPTAVLAAQETEELLSLVRALARNGTAIVLISHFLNEVLGVADIVSIMRDGELVRTSSAADETPARLVEGMVGRPLDIIYPDPPEVHPAAPVVLQVDGIRRGRAVRDVSLQVHQGEIVGLAGLVGSGRTETARLIFGADPLEGGTVSIGGRSWRRLTPSTAMSAGVAMIPESRKDDGLILVRSVLENVSLASLSSYCNAGVIRKSREKHAVQRFSALCDVRAPHLTSPAWQLSGGNQQKVMFAKWFARKPKILIADEPTRGVDIAAKAQIYRLLVEAAASGVGILLISSEIEELLALTHRVYVMRQGRVVRTFARGEAGPETILAAAFTNPPAGDAA